MRLQLSCRDHARNGYSTMQQWLSTTRQSLIHEGRHHDGA